MTEDDINRAAALVQKGTGRTPDEEAELVALLATATGVEIGKINTMIVPNATDPQPSMPEI